jgi:hypothetical protein
MPKSETIEARDDTSGLEEAKVRKCLRCQEEFRSEWAGERICGRCKGSNAWRSNVPLHPRPSSGGF